SCIMGAINIEKIRELFGIPEEDQIRLVLALGKPSHTSTIVPVKEDESIKYYLDEDRNYYVPKRSFEDIVQFV
ncbi:MAG: nitroreductase, partial [Oscillospiraceae bacterium]|nr:nitroreductase [Oscillospiraceae bacterium]